MKTAIVTDFLNQLGGAEIVTHEIANLLPDADIFTLMAREKVLEKYFPDRKIIQHPKLRHSRIRRKHYKKLLPLYPTYIEDFDLKGYDLVISSSYLWAKGVLTRPNTKHISYVHTPIRQAWIKYHEYLYEEKDVGRFTRPFLRYVMNYIRLWDVCSANRVDHFIANSTIVKKRIESIYRRDAHVIHPPVKVNEYKNISKGNEKEKYFITVGRLVPYKRVDLLIKTFNELPDQELLILGDGNDMERLKGMKKSDNISFLGYVDEHKKNKLVADAKAFLFAAEEDFGMSPVEAMALGTPVIGFNKGGTKDYIRENTNGVFFKEQSVESLTKTLNNFDEKKFDREIIIDTVARFDVSVFRKELKRFISDKINSY